jgi:(5-formylfuran-3-yl)methyl phosphate synthase
MAGLLVSVRSVAEARAAVAGGAALVDIKEPGRGSLGRADDETIAAVVAFAGKRTPVSAALGELLPDGVPLRAPGLSYAKWGLAGCGRFAAWPLQLAQAAARMACASPSCRSVAVAYADWERAAAPPVREVLAVAVRHGQSAILLDTWCKDDTTLLNWLSVDAIDDICRTCRAAGIQIALAGRLGRREIEKLRDVRPTWFAVRSAVCRRKSRQQPIDLQAVQELVDYVARRVTASAEN